MSLLSNPKREWAATGTPVLLALASPASSVGGGAPIRYNFQSALSAWSLRCKMNGGATECSVQLLGTVASSSDADATLVALTTWTLTANSCDSFVSITGKPVTSVLVSVTTLGGSTGANVNAWICGTP